MRKPIIAIDGLSSTGKSSISKAIAEKLGLIHVDTGALYRGITYFALQNYFNDDEINIPLLIENLDKIRLQFRNEDGNLILYLNDKNIEEEIRDTKISDHVSIIAKQKEVRDHLLEIQRSFGKNGGIIVDGRDIATVVFPNADFKFFLTASKEERAKRRFLELQQNGIDVQFEEVLKNLIRRDEIDSSREVAPLKMAEDAILIDNTQLTKQETIDEICKIVVKK